MGKSAAKKSEQLSTQAGNNFGALATTLTNNAAPALKQSQDYYSAVLKGGPAAYQAVAPAAEFTKQQYTNERRQLQDQAPAGGAVPAARTAMAQGEAQTISGLYKANLDNAAQNLSQLGEFGIGAGLGANTGLTSTAKQLSDYANQRLGSWLGFISGSAKAAGAAAGGA